MATFELANCDGLDHSCHVRDPVTDLAGSLATMTAYLRQASVNLFFAVAGLIATVAAVLTFGYVLRMLWRAHLENERRISDGR